MVATSLLSLPNVPGPELACSSGRSGTAHLAFEGPVSTFAEFRQSKIRDLKGSMPLGSALLLENGSFCRGHEWMHERGERVDKVRRARDYLCAALGVRGHQRLVEPGGLEVKVAPSRKEHHGLQTEPQLDGLHGVDVVLQVTVDLVDEVGVVLVIR